MRLFVFRAFFIQLLLVAYLFSSARHGFASGFGIFTQSADALGQANATTAHSDGPSAVFFNPALLTELPGTQLEIGTTVILPSRDFMAEDGTTADNRDTAYFPSSFYISHQFGDRFSAGLGVFNSFGLGTVWDSDWPGRFIATKSRITTFNINPTLAWQLSPRFSFGAGLNILLLDAKLKNKVDLSTFGEPEIGQQFTGSGEAAGFNAGILLKLTDQLSFGAAYRSEIKVDIDGKARFDIPDSASPLISLLFPETRGKTAITLPQQFTAGLAYQFTDAWTMEIGLRWEDWSSFRRLKITLRDPVGGETSSLAPRDWHATWAYNIGTKYRVNDRLAIMAGYLYGENPIPDRTFEPGVPDSDTHLFTLGTEWSLDHLKLALAYGFQLQEDRSKRSNLYGPLANGEYENHLHLIGVSLTHTF
jgi:long-chain fatty acid transport protein